MYSRYTCGNIRISKRGLHDSIIITFVHCSDFEFEFVLDLNLNLKKKLWLHTAIYSIWSPLVNSFTCSLPSLANNCDHKRHLVCRWGSLLLNAVKFYDTVCWTIISDYLLGVLNILTVFFCILQRTFWGIHGSLHAPKWYIHLVKRLSLSKEAVDDRCCICHLWYPNSSFFLRTNYANEDVLNVFLWKLCEDFLLCSQWCNLGDF